MTCKKNYYDETSKYSILNYAKKLEGKSFRNIIDEDLSYTGQLSKENLSNYSSKKAKGSLGHILEKHYFHYDINSNSVPDFEEVGIELKTTPYKINKNKSKSAKERLVLTMINYLNIIDENFDDSHLLEKCQLLLLIFYLYNKEIDKLDYQINYVDLFSFPENDIKIIKSDFEKIKKKIADGEAHNLSEGDTLYLGACTKSSSSKDRRKQPNSKIKAKPRAFCLKSSYMTCILNNYVIPNNKKNNKMEKINFIGDFEKYIKKQIDMEKNLSVYDLMQKYSIKPYTKRPKNLESNLVFKILGLKSNRAEEFIKAGIRIKTIRLEENLSLAEHISLPSFDFITLSEENWEEAEINDYLSQTKFLFVIFIKDKEYKKYRDKKDFINMDKHIKIRNCLFWNMPRNDIDTEVYEVWKRTKKIVNDGIETTIKKSKTYNNLPSSKENRVCHIRPHGKNKKDTLPLPNGEFFSKQSFFINKSYILKEIKKAED